MICAACGKEIPGNSVFCTYCGAKTVSPPAASPAPAVSPAVSPISPASPRMNPAYQTYAPATGAPGRAGKRTAAIVLAVALALSLIGNIALFMSLSGKSAALDKAQTRLSESESELSELQSQLRDLKSQVSTLKSKVDSAENKAASLQEAGILRDGVEDFSASVGSNDFKQYKDIFTYSNAVVIRQGQTADVNVVWANTGTVYWECSNISVVSPKWGENWRGSTITLSLTGLKPGTAVITISNSFNEHELKLLAIVTE